MHQLSEEQRRKYIYIYDREAVTKNMDIMESDIPYTPKHQTEVQAIQELSHFHLGHTHRRLQQAKVTDKNNRDL